jgi:hypothetical protein
MKLLLCGLSSQSFITEQKKNFPYQNEKFFFYAPAGIRTLDTRLKRAVLYLLSYWGI